MTLSRALPPVRGETRRWTPARVLGVVGLVLAGLMWLQEWVQVGGLLPWQQDFFAVDTVIDWHRPPPRPDALVVLGYSVDHARREPTLPLLTRLQVAVRLACAPIARRVHDPALAKHNQDNYGGYFAVIFSGGLSARAPLGQASEAQVMSETFAKLWESSGSECRGKPMPKFILEETSSSTFENARNVLALLLRRSQEEPVIRSLHLITNRFHQQRALKTFQKVESKRLQALAQRRAQAVANGAGDGSATATVATSSAASLAANSNAQSSSSSSSSDDPPPPPQPEKDLEVLPFTFTVASLAAYQDPFVPQLDFWREVAATLLYWARGWI
jgi:hypothetical protein